MNPLRRYLLPALVSVAPGCIDLSSIKVTIVDDSGWETGQTETTQDDTPETTDDDTGDSAPATGDDSGIKGDSGSSDFTPPDGYTGPPLGDDVLIYQGYGALPVDSGAYLIDGVDELVDMYLSLGGDTVITDTWPDDPSPYRLVLWYLPGASEEDGFTVPDAALLSILDWLGRGGRLVLAGDVDTVYDGYSLTNANQVIDNMLERMDVDIRLSETLPEPSSCDDPMRTDLLASGDLISAYFGNTVEIGSRAQWIYCDGIAVQNVWCGEVVVSGDVNLISDRPDVAPDLVQNLYTVPVASSCQ